MNARLRDVSFGRRWQSEKRAADHLIQFVGFIAFAIGLGLGLVILYFDHR